MPTNMNLSFTDTLICVHFKHLNTGLSLSFFWNMNAEYIKNVSKTKST